MSFLGRLFSAPDAVAKGVDAVINTGDALIFTKEEQSQANHKLLELKIKAAEATHGSRLARRLLALMFCGVFLFWFSVACLLSVIAASVCGTAEDCWPLVARDGLMQMLTSAAVGGSVVAIISWYFWSGVKRVDE